MAFYGYVGSSTPSGEILPIQSGYVAAYRKGVIYTNKFGAVVYQIFTNEPTLEVTPGTPIVLFFRDFTYGASHAFVINEYAYGKPANIFTISVASTMYNGDNIGGVAGFNNPLVWFGTTYFSWPQGTGDGVSTKYELGNLQAAPFYGQGYSNLPKTAPVSIAVVATTTYWPGDFILPACSAPGATTQLSVTGYTGSAFGPTPTLFRWYIGGSWVGNTTTNSLNYNNIHLENGRTANCSVVWGSIEKLTPAVTINVPIPVVPGTISSSLNHVGYGATPTITLTGFTGATYQYSWYYGTAAPASTSAADVTAWFSLPTTINALSAANPYTTGALIVNAWYGIKVTGNSCNDNTNKNTNVVAIAVDAVSAAGTISPITPTIGYNKTVVLTLSGYRGTIQWQTSTTYPGTFTNIVGATSATYTTPGLTAQTYYQCVVTNGLSPAVTSGVATVAVNAASVSGTISPSSTVIVSGTTTTLYLQNNVGSIQWLYSASGTAGTFAAVTNGSGGTAAAYTTPTLTAAAYYQVMITNGASDPAYSATTTVTVGTISAGYIVGPSCVSYALQTLTIYVEGYTTSPAPTAFQWQYSTDNNPAYFYDGGALFGSLTTAYGPFNPSTHLNYRIRITYPGPTYVYNEYVYTISPLSYPGVLCAPGCDPNPEFGYNDTTTLYCTTPPGNPTAPVGSIIYQYSTATTAYTTITGATVTPYFTFPMTQTTYFQVTATSGCSAPVKSNMVKILIDAPTSVGTLTVSSNEIDISGSVTFSAPSAVGTIQLQASTDSLFTSPVTVGASQGGTIVQYGTPVTGISYSQVVSTITTTRYYRLYVKNGQSSAVYSNTVQVIVDVTPIVGTLSASATEITTNDSVIFTTTSCTGIIQLQSAPTNTFTSPTNIGTTQGSTNGLITTFSQTVYNITTNNLYYRLKVTNGTVSVYSNIIQVQVDAASVAGTISPATITIGNNTSTTLSVSGYTGTAFQWVSSSTSGGTYANVVGGTGATTTTYTTPNLTTTTYYKCVVTNGVSASDTTASAATVTVDAASVAGTISPATITIGNNTSTTLSVSGYTGTAFQWVSSSTSGGTYANVTGATTASYTTPNLTTTTYYKCVVTNGVSASDTTASAATVTVNAGSSVGTLTPTVTSPTTNTMYFNDTLQLALSGANVGTDIRIQSSTSFAGTYTDVSGWTQVADATLPSKQVNVPNFTTAQYFRIYAKNNTSSAVTSTPFLVSITPKLVTATGLSTTKVYNGSPANPTFTINPTSGSWGSSPNGSDPTSYFSVLWRYPAFAPTDVSGAYLFDISSNNANYTVNSTSNPFAITATPLTVNFENLYQVVSGAQRKPTIIFTNGTLYARDTLQIRYTKNSSIFNTSYTTTANEVGTSPSAVGLYTITVLNNNNYTLTLNSGFPINPNIIQFRLLSSVPNLVAVGASPTQISVSSDGATWFTILLATMNTINFTDIKWNGYVWLAVANMITLCLSYDGIHWYSYDIPYSIKNLLWDGSYWIGTGVNNGIYYTTDISGISLWQPTSLTSGSYVVAFNGTKWIAAGSSVAYTTTNITNWGSSSTIPLNTVKAIKTNGSIWVMVGISSKYSVAYSKDGITWIGVQTPSFTAGCCVEWNGIVWVAGGIGTNSLAYSYDGINWVELGATIFQQTNSVAWLSALATPIWVAVGTDYNNNNITAVSDDGQYWVPNGNPYDGSGNVMAIGSQISVITFQNYSTIYTNTPFQVVPLFYPRLIPKPPLNYTYINTYTYIVENPVNNYVTGTNVSIPMLYKPYKAGEYYVDVSTTNIQQSFIPFLPSHTLIIERKPVQVDLSNATLVQSYNGIANPISATITATWTSGFQSTIPAFYTYNDAATPIPYGRGMYEVTASPTDVNYVGAESATLIITQKIIDIVVTNNPQIYNGSPLVPTITFIPADKAPFIVLYDGSADAPINAGEHALNIYINDIYQNYVGQLISTFTIQKKVIPLLLSDLSQTYQGIPLTPTATTVPQKLAITYYFDGSTAPAINVRKYQVVANISDLNYLGNAIDVFEITRGVAYISFVNTVQDYTGFPLVPTIETYPYGADYTVTYDGKPSPLPVNPGYYVVGVNLASENFTGFAYTVFTISKVPAQITLLPRQTAFTGKPLSTFATTIPSSLYINYLYNGNIIPPSSVGTYNVVAAISDIKYTGSASNIFTITPKTGTITISSLLQQYTGTYISTTGYTNPVGLSTAFTYTYLGSNTIPVNVGKYGVVGFISDSTYFGSSFATLEVVKQSTPMVVSISSVRFNKKLQTGLVIPTPSTVAVSYLYQSISSSIVSPFTTQPVFVGDYKMTASINNDPNYGGSLSSVFTILPATAYVKFYSQYTAPYTGKPHSNMDFDTLPFSNISTTNTFKSYPYQYGGYMSTLGPKNVGYYTQLTRTNDTNYTGYSTSYIHITPASNYIEFPVVSQKYTTFPQPISTLAYSIVPPYPLLPVNVLYNGVSAPPITVGTYNVVATIADSNYTGVNSTIYTITRGSPQIVFTNIKGVYSTPFVPGITVIPNSASYPYLTYSYNNKVVTPVNAGEYALTATINDTLWYAVSTTTIEIDKLTLSTCFTGLIQPYTGVPMRPSLYTNPGFLTIKYSYSSVDEPSSFGVYSISGVIHEANYQGQATTEYSIVLGPVQGAVGYPVDKGAVLTWLPPSSDLSGLEYTIYSIPATSNITTRSTFATFSGLTNNEPYQFIITASDNIHTGLPYLTDVLTWSGSGFQGMDDGYAPSVTYKTPVDIAYGAGSLYVADATSVRIIDNNNTVTTVNPLGFTFGTIGGIASRDDSVFITDTSNNVIFQITFNPTIVRIVAGQVGVAGFLNTDAASSLFNGPTGIAVDAVGNIFVADTGNNQVRLIDICGNVTTYAGTGAPGDFDGRGTFALFNAPRGVEVGPNGVVYVADTGNNSIRQISPGPYNITNVTTIVRNDMLSGDKFNAPTKVVWDGANMLFVADSANNRIRRVDITAQTMMNLAGLSCALLLNGDGFDAAFNRPTGLTLTPDKTLFVADTGNFVIRRIRFNPLVTVIPNITPHYAPGPPTNVNVIADSTTLIVSWVPPIENILPISYYSVTYDGDITLTTPNPIITLTDLIPNTEYTITIVSNNLFGASSPASTTGKTLVVDVTIFVSETYVFYTGSPQNPKVTTVPPILPYTISYTNPPATSKTAVGVYSGVVDISYNNYQATTPFTFTILTATPSAPLNPRIQVRPNSLVISWNPPANTGPGYIAYYTVSYSAPIAFTRNTDNGSVTSMTLSGLQNGVSYTFSITATNVYGNDVFGVSPAAHISGTPVGPPERPLLPTVVMNVNNITVSWVAPSNGGSPIQYYTIYPLVDAVSQSYTPSTINTSYTFTTGLVGGTDYQFQITATNAIGTSDLSVATNSIEARTVPGTPVVFANITLQKARITWSVPPNGGIPITGYIVQSSPATTTYEVTNGETTTLEIMGLTPGQSYCFSVAAKNLIGIGIAGNSPYCVAAARAPNELYGPRNNRPSWFG